IKMSSTSVSVDPTPSRLPIRGTALRQVCDSDYSFLKLVVKSVDRAAPTLAKVREEQPPPVTTPRRYKHSVAPFARARDLAPSKPTNQSLEWEVLHIHEFCPESEDICQHECMIEGLDDVFNHFNEKLKPNNSWRKKELYQINKYKQYCIICVSEVRVNDHCVGVFQRVGSAKKKATKRLKAYVMHDTCLSSISMNKKAVLPAMESLLKSADVKKVIEKYCIFESVKNCFECKQGLYLERMGNNKIVRCSDAFCGHNMHWECALRSETCRMNFADKTLYCKDHAVGLPQSNDAGSRGSNASQSLTEFEICMECSRSVARWPLPRKVFYLRCCESFIHYDCATKRLRASNMSCGKCGSMNKFLESVQSQGHCLQEYREEMEKYGAVDNMSDLYLSDIEEESDISVGEDSDGSVSDMEDEGRTKGVESIYVEEIPSSEEENSPPIEQNRMGEVKRDKSVEIVEIDMEEEEREKSVEIVYVKQVFPSSEKEKLSPVAKMGRFA
ncbi:hypothetical protein PMAYCL1PPCAC_31515, partial [Pristionchus mayeri]